MTVYLCDHPCSPYLCFRVRIVIVDDRKVDHLRETYIKSDCFHVIQSKSTLNIKVH